MFLQGPEPQDKARRGLITPGREHLLVVVASGQCPATGLRGARRGGPGLRERASWMLGVGCSLCVWSRWQVPGVKGVPAQISPRSLAAGQGGGAALPAR